MNKPTPPLNLPDSAPELALRLGAVLAGLVGLIARRFLRMPHLMGFTVLLCGRLGRMARRFERLMTRPARVRAPRMRAGRGPASGGDGVRVRSTGLPSGRGWLVRELGWEAAGYGSQLGHLLDDPAMQALAARVPGIGRILRPLCRMLGVPLVAPVVLAASQAVAAVEAVEAVEVAVAPLVRPWADVVEMDEFGLPGGCSGAPIPV